MKNQLIPCSLCLAKIICFCRRKVHKTDENWVRKVHKNVKNAPAKVHKTAKISD